jgi:hypothetical protein
MALGRLMGGGQSHHVRLVVRLRQMLGLDLVLHLGHHVLLGELVHLLHLLLQRVLVQGVLVLHVLLMHVLMHHVLVVDVHLGLHAEVRTVLRFRLGRERPPAHNQQHGHRRDQPGYAVHLCATRGERIAGQSPPTVLSGPRVYNQNTAPRQTLAERARQYFHSP